MPAADDAAEVMLELLSFNIIERKGCLVGRLSQVGAPPRCRRVFGVTKGAHHLAKLSADNSGGGSARNVSSLQVRACCLPKI